MNCVYNIIKRNSWFWLVNVVTSFHPFFFKDFWAKSYLYLSVFLITSCVIAQKFFEFLTMYKSSATHFGIINATIRSCGELWLVEGCPHMNPPLPLYQPQLDTWASYGIYCAKICGTGLIFQPFDTTIGHPINTCLYFTFKSLLLYISSSVLHI